MTVAPLLGHAGAGSTWQAMTVVAAVVLGVAFLTAAAGRLRLDSGDDLVLPVAAAAIASSLAPFADAWLSDAVGWALPVLVTALLGLLLGALTPLDVRFPAPLPMGAVALAGVTALLLHPTLTAALHPPGETLPLRDDAEVRIVTPTEGGRVDADGFEVVVEVVGGSIGPGEVPPAALPEDPEEAADLAVAIEEVRDDRETQQRRVEVVYEERCTVPAPCSSVRFPLSVEPGVHELTVELTRGDGVPFAPAVREQISFRAE